MPLLFSKVVSDDPYVVELVHGTNLVHVHADWFGSSDEARDRLETAISRFPEARSFSYWLGWFEFSLVATFKTESEADQIAKKLRGNGPAIYRYLAAHENGVSFTEFCEYREPITGNRLTETDNARSIAATLRRHSQVLSRYGKRIEARPSENLIKLSSRK